MEETYRSIRAEMEAAMRTFNDRIKALQEACPHDGARRSARVALGQREIVVCKRCGKIVEERLDSHIWPRPSAVLNPEDLAD